MGLLPTDKYMGVWMAPSDFGGWVAWTGDGKTSEVFCSADTKAKLKSKIKTYKVAQGEPQGLLIN